MAKSNRTVRTPPAERVYWGADIPMRVIRRYARAVAERFEPEKIILFGSYAYGTPHADSDVDILVVMPARNQLDQAYKIRCAVSAPFPLDLIVRTPYSMKWRLAEGELFLTEIVTKGKVLYEKDDRRVGGKGRRRSRQCRATQPKQDAASYYPGRKDPHKPGAPAPGATQARSASDGSDTSPERQRRERHKPGAPATGRPIAGAPGL